MQALPVYERFHSWQGEGCHMGRSAYFIRLHGCPVHCPWCDSAGTWHPDWIPGNVPRETPEKLADAAAGSGAEIVILTGGEPAIHDLNALTATLAAQDNPVHIETCGAYELRGEFDWVTVSPKWWKLPTPEIVRSAHELKIIVEDENSIEKWMDHLDGDFCTDHVWLHPEWTQRNNPGVLNSITSWIRRHGKPFRAGHQLHKFFKADEQDPASRPQIPLGGIR
tara:strand:- start:459 stop:1127 length:669 start_codon:yes stop_codon:yes gene_type:complete